LDKIFKIKTIKNNAGPETEQTWKNRDTKTTTSVKEI
jgi:hypothetical protein